MFPAVLFYQAAFLIIHKSGGDILCQQNIFLNGDPVIPAQPAYGSQGFIAQIEQVLFIGSTVTFHIVMTVSVPGICCLYTFSALFGIKQHCHIYIYTVLKQFLYKIQLYGREAGISVQDYNAFLKLVGTWHSLSDLLKDLLGCYIFFIYILKKFSVKQLYIRKLFLQYPSVTALVNKILKLPVSYSILHKFRDY